MKYDVVVPPVGESITEVTVAQWLKQDGDFVEADDLICEIESDKASFEIPAEKSGVLSRKAQEGDTIAIGDTVAIIDTEAKGSKAKESSAAQEQEPEKRTSNTLPEARAHKQSATAEKISPASESAAGQSSQIKVPQVGESITEVTIAAWLKDDGATISSGDLICEIESDKASFEIPAENGGKLVHKAKEGETVAIGSIIAEVIRDGKEAAVDDKQSKAAADSAATESKTQNGRSEKQEKTEQSSAAQKSTTKSKVTPLAQHILDDAGVSADKIEGSGPGGAITRDDALYAVRKARENGQPSQPQQLTSQDLSGESSGPARQGSAGKVRQERREKLSTLRKTIAKRLVTVKNETAMLTTFNEVDMSEIKKLRSAYKESFKEKHGVGLGFMSFFTRAVCQALQEWPAVNASIDDDHIIYHDYCDISIAVSTPKGLVVPVIRNAEQLTMAGIEKEVVNLATRARDGKLTIEEMTGGTFTLTNGGVFGSLMSTPIINAPQSAILGMHKIEDRPMALGGQVVIKPMMYLALSYDHRIIDGRESVSFLVRVKELLENPSRMLLEI